MKRSFIREILEHTSSNTISFAGGLPNAKLFPKEQLKRSAQVIIDDSSSLQYGNSTGYEKLKEKIAKLYCDDGFPTKESNILITSGSQQALDIIARYNNNKNITIEAPSYLGAMNIFNLNNMNLDTVELQNDGCNIEEFKKSITNTKLAYLIPDFQNPTGISYSINKRETIANIIKEQNAILIEDAPYSDIYFKTKFECISKNIPSNSYHLGSFSKVLAPSLRIGWIRADEKLLKPLIAYKEAMDLHTNGLTQFMLNNYLQDNIKFENHKVKIRKTYAKSLQIFCSYLDDILPEFEYVKPQGGMFIYGRIKDINTKDLVEKCLKQDVVFVPGVEFYINNKKQDEVRFNFTNTSASQIYKGLNIIKNIINKGDLK
jgi:2-aminoadipate transaminase